MPDYDNFDTPHTMVNAGRFPDPGEQPTGHYLVAVDGSDVGRVVELTAVPLTIGRDPRQPLVFADSELSRAHVLVSLVNGAVIAEDLNSTNGTFVNGIRITGPTPVEEGATLRVGGQLLKYERRDRREAARAQEIHQELAEARKYLLAMLPRPIEAGAIHARWTYVPSTQLGGDAFGYDWLDAERFAFFLLDVSGHGVGPALHAVSVLNVLRQRTLPGVDFGDPGAVLSSLNQRFQMTAHDGMFFTIWYGVYHTPARTLAFSAAGHHAAYLVSADRSASRPLENRDLMIGAIPDISYDVHRADVPPGSTVFVFSDGVFEIVTKEQQPLALPDFVPHLTAPAVDGVPEPERLLRAVRERAAPGPLEDDFSVVAVTFV